MSAYDFKIGDTYKLTQTVRFNGYTEIKKGDNFWLANSRSIFELKLAPGAILTLIDITPENNREFAAYDTRVIFKVCGIKQFVSFVISNLNSIAGNHMVKIPSPGKVWRGLNEI